MVSGAQKSHKYAEFFCGGGMVSAALPSQFDCAFANDIDPMKCAAFADNWGAQALVEGDIARVDTAALMQPIDLFWASSPCQDFSVAGVGQGLAGARSGVFHAWINAITPVIEGGFAPAVIAFENVVGLMSRQSGQNLTAVLHAIIALGYRVGLLEVDAVRFVPQSRPRLFVIAVRNDLDTKELETSAASGPFHTAKVALYAAQAPRDVRAQMLWWKHDAPAQRNTALADLLDTAPDTAWYTRAELTRLTAMMSPLSRAKVSTARTADGPVIGTLYKRGRPDAQGVTRQRAELRFDGVAGCLRTPAGGSSRQTLFIVDGRRTRARLLSSREAVRLMGLPDTYRIPPKYNAAYKIAGDGVVVPVVRYLSDQIIQPALNCARTRAAA